MWKSTDGLQSERSKDSGQSKEGKGAVLSPHVLRERAFLLELEKAVQPQILPDKKKMLEKVFDKIYSELQPADQDYRAREDSIKFVENLVRQKVSVGNNRKEFGVCHVTAFGSYTMNLFTPTSDLDLSLNVECGAETISREDKIKILRSLTRCLYGLQNGGGRVRDIEPVLRANVPVVKFVDCKSGLQCDVSVENKDGILKSELLCIFSTLDIRFRKLCFLVKAWAKEHGINNSKERTLNSLSIILLVAFHLQTRSPPILPPFSVFLEDLHTPATSSIIEEVQRRAQKYKDFSKKNNESVVQLFNSLLVQLVAVEDLWLEGLCASTYQGTWTSAPKPNWIYVEDFTVQSQNAARAVGDNGFDAIYSCLHEAVMQMKKYFTDVYEVKVLKTLLFSPPVKPSVRPGKKRLHDNRNQVAPKQQKTQEKGVSDQFVAKQHKTNESVVFSDIASWIAFGDRPAHPLPVNNTTGKTWQGDSPASRNSRLLEATFRERHARHIAVDNISLQSRQLEPHHIAVYNSSLQSRQSQYPPSRNSRLLEATFGDRHIHHFPADNSLQSRQGELPPASWNRGLLEATLGDRLAHHITVDNNSLQSRYVELPTVPRNISLLETITRPQLHQERQNQEHTGMVGRNVLFHEPAHRYPAHAYGVLPPGLANDGNAIVRVSKQYDNSRTVMYPDAHADLVSYQPAQHKQYNRSYYSSPSRYSPVNGMYHTPMYNGYDDVENKYNQYGGRWVE